MNENHGDPCCRVLTLPGTVLKASRAWQVHPLETDFVVSHCFHSPLPPQNPRKKWPSVLMQGEVGGAEPKPKLTEDNVTACLLQKG